MAPVSSSPPVAAGAGFAAAPDFSPAPTGVAAERGLNIAAERGFNVAAERAFNVAAERALDIAAERGLNIAALRRRIKALEWSVADGGDDGGPAVVPLGVEAIDAALPWGGLPRGAVHAITAAGAEPSTSHPSRIHQEPSGEALSEPPGDGGLGALSAFAAALAARFAMTSAARFAATSDTRFAATSDTRSAAISNPRFAATSDTRFAAMPGPVLWCLARDDLYAHGLRAFGLDPARLILVRARRAQEVLWVLEEALRAGGLSVVVGEVAAVDLTAGRRLQLAARTGGGSALLLDRAWSGAARRHAAPAGAVTRWAVAPMAAGAGAPRWQIELVRCRVAVAGQRWQIEWRDASGGFALAAALADRSGRARRSA